MTGIDVSKWQGHIDWSKVKGKVDFAILRAGYGNTAKQKDSFFEEYYTGCKANGIPVGAYWYSYATSIADAEKEADACIQCLAGKQFEFPIYFDIEDSTQGSFSKSLKTSMVIAFCNKLEKAGYYAGWYTYTSWALSGFDLEKLSRFTFWLADYRLGYNKTLTRDMHQFSSSGRIDGIDGRVDLNTCTKDFPTIIKRAGLNGYSVDSDKKMSKITFAAMSAGDAKKVKALGDSLKLEYKEEEV